MLPGELKILIFPNEKSSHKDIVAMHLRDSEDESCLWRLRCGDANLGAEIQATINATDL